jgi:FkbM family methyltransferase
MLNMLRKSLPAPIKRRLKQVLGRPQTRLHPDWAILKPIGPVYRPHVMLDVGAHAGWFFHCWHDWCPQASVHAFEPYPPSFANMQALYGSDPCVMLNETAVGSAIGKSELNVLADSLVSNSLLAPDQSTWDEVHYRTGAVSRVTVPVTTLDAYCAQHAVDRVYLIKIDVQGFELEVLRGAQDTLARTDHVFVESAIRPLYHGSASFTAVADFMQSQGFHLMTLRAWHRGNHVLMETDMLFRRDALAPPIDDSVVRVMEHA